MAIDTEGNIYAAAGVGKDAGIYIFSPMDTSTPINVENWSGN